MRNGQFRPTGFSLLPPVIKNLLIINGIFFLATFALGNSMSIDLTDILGLHYWGSDKFRPYQFITYMFMHSSFNFMHILFNMLALWMFGNALENIWGPRRFLIYYLVTGIGAALVHYIVFYFQVSPVLAVVNEYLANPSLEGYQRLHETGFFRTSMESINVFNAFIIENKDYLNSNPDRFLQLSSLMVSEVKTIYLNAPVVIGASGAVFGILLAFGMMFPNTYIYLYFAIPIKAKWFVIIYGAIELYSGFSDSTSNVAHFAHLGGMIFGFFLIRAWRKNLYNSGGF
jgi:membrane associated rhomboid family serine protease